MRCAIVGYGKTVVGGQTYYWPKRYHADAIRKVPGSILAGICDTNPARLDAARQEFPDVVTFSSVEDTIVADGVDLCVVATPHHLHGPIALQLLEAGKHVVCEKPFCLTTAEADAMIQAARANGVMLSAYHNRRWDGDFMRIREIVQSGMIGDIFHIEAFAPITNRSFEHPGHLWRSHKPISGGALYDWGSHFLDWILLLLMPWEIENVLGIVHKRVWTDVTIEDQVQVIVRFEGGRNADLQLSDIAAVHKPKWRILGTRGGILVDEYGGDATVRVSSFTNDMLDEQVLQVPERRWESYYENIADHLLSGEPLIVTPEAARRVIAVIEAAMRSAESGQLEPVADEI